MAKQQKLLEEAEKNGNQENYFITPRESLIQKNENSVLMPCIEVENIPKDSNPESQKGYELNFSSERSNRQVIQVYAKR